MLLSPHHHRFYVWSPIDNRSLAARFPTLALTVGDVDKLADRLPIVIPASSQGETPLPIALVTPTQTANPFGEYMPQLMRDYPFQLVPQALCLNDAGETVFQDALWAAPDAPHWQTNPQNGYRLFDDEGQPSAALTDVLARLRALQPEIARTQALVNLLMQAGVLWQQQVHHLEQVYAVYKVEITEGLGEQLEALDSSQAGKALWLAERMEHSQQSLAFLPPSPSPYGVNGPYGAV